MSATDVRLKRTTLEQDPTLLYVPAKFEYEPYSSRARAIETLTEFL